MKNYAKCAFLVIMSMTFANVASAQTTQLVEAVEGWSITSTFTTTAVKAVSGHCEVKQESGGIFIYASGDGDPMMEVVTFTRGQIRKVWKSQKGVVPIQASEQGIEHVRQCSLYRLSFVPDELKKLGKQPAPQMAGK